MSFNDWEDDLLNFDYSDNVPAESPTGRAGRTEPRILDNKNEIEDAIRREEERARKLRDEYDKLRAASKAQREEPVEIPRRDVELETAEEHRARAAAQEEAYRKFREEYRDPQPANRKADKAAAKEAAREAKSSRKSRKSAASLAGDAAKASGLNKFARVLSIPYVILFAVFMVVMTLMNVLPFFWWVALLIVLGLLSIILLAQLRKTNIKRWAKIAATITASLLIVMYGMGTVYAVGTLSFLDKTSVKNDNKVAHITREPFNVLITGMDVWGKVDEQGRSDVNMLVTVNPKTEQLLMTSIPRDYEIQMPDFNYATDKLTHTGFYSVETTKGAVETLLNTEANYYVKVNFSTIVKFIDAIGGLDFNNEIEFTSDITGHLYEKGMIHVQGRGALYYARERHAFIDGDNQRIKNQQKIFSEMLKKATSSRTMLLSYNKILTELDDYFEMSISSKEIRSLLKMQLARNIKWKMYKNSVVGGNGSMGTYTTGGQKCYVMTQDPTSIDNAQTLIQAVLNGQQLTKDKDGNVIVAPEEGAEGTTDAAA